MGNGKTADTRQEALATDASFYHGRPCKYGHGTVRLTCNSTCYTCQRQRSDKWYENTKEENKDARKEKSREYYLANKEKIKANTKTYKEGHKEYYEDYMKEYYSNNKEDILQCRKDRYIENREHELALNKQYRDKNPDLCLEIKRRHYEENKHIYIARSAARRRKERQATPAWADWNAIASMYELSEFATDQSGCSYHVDHIVPIFGKTVCGLHVENNLRVITAFENQSKSNKLIEELL